MSAGRSGLEESFAGVRELEKLAFFSGRSGELDTDGQAFVIPTAGDGDRRESEDVEGPSVAEHEELLPAHIDVVSFQFRDGRGLNRCRRGDDDISVLEDGATALAHFVESVLFVDVIGGKNIFAGADALQSLGLI